ncbi:DNA cytosine methyltransferase [Sphingosinicella sp. BN140058]|uniref:DNA cytosine methyltransferase n=1 Tax=Sphingosinicella sp. BN140058 TaxID=1892855 RepID=UPI0010135490|nr:DNA cytosine methyltransferase [Sphingosinicella sp. BN140058]QAY80379.1 DNA cytosine methyltransferase [Sphingosinicella sp. BN140058]
MRRSANPPAQKILGLAWVLPVSRVVDRRRSYEGRMKSRMLQRMLMTTETLVRVNVPEIATKQLRFRHVGSRRILTISSNLLELFGFRKGDTVVERSLGAGKGMVIERAHNLFDQPRVKKVYARSYPRRKNNPLEHQVEVSSQRLLDASFPKDCTRVHVRFEAGLIVVTPLRTISERALANAAAASPSATFAALTSGVDLASLRSEGFSISAILEWRPQESRDTTDLTETGALAALANSGPVRALFNEDVTSAVLDEIEAAMARSPIMLFHASPQCDDHSTLKPQQAKQKHHEDGTSTEDMIIDLLNIVERLAPPVILFENVPGMLTSAAYHVASLRLRRWGYKQFEHVGDARDYGGLTSRRRAYVVFSQLAAPFAFEEPFTDRKKDAWAVVANDLADCRDVSGSKSLQDGKASGRLRRLTPASTSIPTPVKSQPRMAKDSIVIEPEEDVFLWPTEGQLKRFLGIEDVDLSAVSSTIASEIIGQSIDRPHHASVLRSVSAHIAHFRSGLARPLRVAA